MAAAFGAIGSFRRDDEFTPTADFHTWDAFLPPSNQPIQPEPNRTATVPGRVEFLVCFVINAHVVDFNIAVWLGFWAVALNQIGDDYILGGPELFSLRREAFPSGALSL